MKSYSGIPYTTGKQAADDVKTQLVGFIKIPKWLLGLCLITVFYILFVCFSMYKIGDSTTQLYEYPYTVSRKAQEMKNRPLWHTNLSAISSSHARHHRCPN